VTLTDPRIAAGTLRFSDVAASPLEAAVAAVVAARRLLASARVREDALRDAGRRRDAGAARSAGQVVVAALALVRATEAVELEVRLRPFIAAGTAPADDDEDVQRGSNPAISPGRRRIGDP